MQDKLKYKTVWTVNKYHTDDDYQNGAEPYETIVKEGNVLLNEGIALLWDLGIAAGGTAWDNTNANLGVGDSATAANATQTALQAAANKLYKGMEATYPQRTAQTVRWRSAFTDAEANFAWEEVTVANANSDAGTNLNRAVQSLGTKASGTWTLDLDITLS